MALELSGLNILNIGGNDSGLSNNFIFNVTGADGTSNISEYVQIKLRIIFADMSDISHIGFELIRIKNNNSKYTACRVMDTLKATSTKPQQMLTGFVTNQQCINELTSPNYSSSLKYALKIIYKKNSSEYTLNTIFVLSNTQLGTDFTNSNYDWDDSSSLPYTLTLNEWNYYITQMNIITPAIEEQQN